MSRLNYCDEEDFPGQFHLFQANCARSMAGRAGQVALRELEAALLALPTKRLIANELDNGADCCAIGALARHKRLDPAQLAADHDPEYEMDAIGVECGMPRLVAWRVVEWNDIDLGYHYVEAPGPSRYPGHRYDGGYDLKVEYTPEERYATVLRYVRDLLSQADA